MVYGSALRRIASAALNWVYPPRCMVCDNILPQNVRGALHDECSELLAPIAPPVCTMCGTPMETDGAICASCRARKRECPNTAIFLYDDVIREVIHRFKYSGCRSYAKGLAQIAAVALGEGYFQGGEVLIPIPMHKKKQRKRGYNQAEEFALALSEITGTPVASDYLLRIRNTRPMAGLSPAERANNLNAAFALGKPLKFKSFVLIDDIYTTGETLNACSQLLKEAGGRVRGLTLAIAARKRDAGRRPEDLDVYNAPSPDNNKLYS